MATGQAKAAQSADQIVECLEHFEALDDPRQRGKVLCRPDEILRLVLLGVSASCEAGLRSPGSKRGL